MSDAVNDNDDALSFKMSCPICSKQSEERWRPFCSRRCADVDLHRWLSGSYAIATTQANEDDDVSDQ